jgi:NADP-dependent 3-hydroxy acid dehydrogenase YdfG
MLNEAKTIFITGAASGIGRATARLFASEGWFVGLADRNATALTDLAVEVGASAVPYYVDVVGADALAAAIRNFSESYGGLTAVFNSAGILEMGPFSSMPRDRLSEMVDVNLKGVINSIAAALPHLRGRPGASIVTMGSAAGIHGIPDLAVYSATKFAVRGLTEALNIELEREGIWVTDIMVGYVKTPMLESAVHKARSIDIVGVNVLPETVAAVVWTAVHGRRVHWFVSAADEDFATAVDREPMESRRDIVKPTAGY